MILNDGELRAFGQPLGVPGDGFIEFFKFNDFRPSVNFSAQKFQKVYYVDSPQRCVTCDAIEVDYGLPLDARAIPCFNLRQFSHWKARYCLVSAVPKDWRLELPQLCGLRLHVAHFRYFNVRLCGEVQHHLA